MKQTTTAIMLAAATAFATPALADGHADMEVIMAAVEELGGDVDKGERTFRKCKACHQVGDGAENKTGPVLNGVLGRVAGTVEGFDGYSDVMKEAGAGGLVWTPEEMIAFLTKPKDYMKGTKMSFAGLRKESERADVIAYLATFQ